MTAPQPRMRDALPSGRTAGSTRAPVSVPVPRTSSIRTISSRRLLLQTSRHRKPLSRTEREELVYDTTAILVACFSEAACPHAIALVEEIRAAVTRALTRDLSFRKTGGPKIERKPGSLQSMNCSTPRPTSIRGLPQKNGTEVRVIYNAEMPAEAADPGQDPRGAVDIAPLRNILDVTPAARHGRSSEA